MKPKQNLLPTFAVLLAGLIVACNSKPTSTTTTPPVPKYRLESLQATVSSFTVARHLLPAYHPGDTIWLRIKIWNDNWSIPFEQRHLRYIDTPQDTIHVINGQATFNLTTPLWSGPFTDTDTVMITAWHNNQTGTAMLGSYKVVNLFELFLWHHGPLDTGKGVAELDVPNWSLQSEANVMVHFSIAYTKIH